jgi:trk/ktr system potassium uptake protein
MLNRLADYNPLPKNSINALDRTKGYYVYRTLLGIACFLSVFSIILQYGFVVSPRMTSGLIALNVLTVILFFSLTIFKIMTSKRIESPFRNAALEIILIASLVLEFFIVQSAFPDSRQVIPHLIPAYLISLQVYFMFALGKRMFKAGKKLYLLSFSPATTVAISFIVLIIAGTLALLLPRATHGILIPNISFIDALFTSTSAVCVTGLSTVNTAQDFSRFGQGIILMLIQLGAFGIMIFVGLFAFSFGAGSSLRSRLVLQDILVREGGQHVAALMKVMLITTLVLEGTGAVLLIPGFYGVSGALGESCFDSIFHSVSAFCNAGFSTFPASLELFSDSPLVIITISMLIVCGGIGFGVVYEIGQWIRKRFIQKKRAVRLSLHAIIVLKTSALLIVVGMAAVLIGGDWSMRSGLDVFLSSLFQSITTRTAGFNSIPLGAIAPWCLMVMMILMLIGGAPGGTAGGIKVSTVALLFHTARSLLKGRKQVEIRNRTITQQAIMMAFVICGLAITYIAVATIALVWAEPDKQFFNLLFEVISAFGTVGLSLGVTPELGAIGKMIIIITMYVGRVGPLTVFLGMVRTRDEANYQYPSGSIIIS